MVKWLGIILIFAACCYFGEISSKNLFRRRNFLGDATVFIGTLKSKIRFTGEEIYSAVRESASQPLVKKYFGDFNVVSGEDDFSEIWNGMSAEAAAGCSLTADDLNLLYGLAEFCRCRNGRAAVDAVPAAAVPCGSGVCPSAFIKRWSEKLWM